ncbi:unnamed protein product [Phytomonas sp. EM1]|nr:unnamed protein product [Phytomonas sp. EM1]|eukprot:CCW59942.1 unnamed protein product [Phytomonas sp. isolate EM1]
MSITLKLVNGTQKSLEVPNLGITVAEFKKLSETVIEIPADEQRVVLRGKVLKDEDILSNVGMEHGNAVHIVRSKKKEVPSSATQATQPAQTQSGPTAVQSGTPSNSSNPSDYSSNPYAALFGGYGGPQAPTRGADNAANSMTNPWASAMMGMGWGQPPNDAMQMLQNPMTMQFVQEVMRNPALMQQLVQYEPMLSNIPPEVQQQAMQMASNPEIIRQMMSIYSGAGNANTAPASNPNIGGVGNNSSTPQGVPGGYPLSSMFPMPQPQGDPRVIYREQLQQLREMGFPNEDANIAALQQSQGNVSFAIERLFNA